ncbi:ankyrin repeat domain-containing protein [Eleftheria terrae]|uniref:ankyrin repeat domain-containing protein n=1 Tax=Eleftheria terrae TaxID=1597781 RepID=UPI00263B28DE|nr:ankyrin repeat domain-containing protein [Eleftheria terrae]WKB53307.1 ankyrin repeat domain-containing protein [Eleftheria terrae]
MRIELKWVWALVLALAAPMAQAGAYVDFFRALMRDDGDTVRELLQRGFDPNTLDEHGRAGLTIALQEVSLKTAEALFAHPQVDVNRLNALGESPLMMAALKRELDWCRRLIERGADVNKTGWTPLHYAASGGKPEVVALLLEHHAFIDAESPNKTTPLMMAARYGSDDATRVLLEAGADPTLRNEKGLTAADFARAAERVKLAEEIERHARTYNAAPAIAAPASGAD